MNDLRLLSYDPSCRALQVSLCALFSEAFGEYPAYYALWREYLATPSLTFLWGTDSLCPIAHIQVVDYCWRSEAVNYPAAYLYAVCTAEQERGRGVMSACLGMLLPLLLQRGYTAVLLQPSSLSLVGYYERFGFVRRAEEVRPFDTALRESLSSVIYPAERALRYLRKASEIEPEELLTTPWMVYPGGAGGCYMPEGTVLLSPLQ